MLIPFLHLLLPPRVLWDQSIRMIDARRDLSYQTSRQTAQSVPQLTNPRPDLLLHICLFRGNATLDHSFNILRRLFKHNTNSELAEHHAGFFIRKISVIFCNPCHDPAVLLIRRHHSSKICRFGIAEQSDHISSRYTPRAFFPA